MNEDADRLSQIEFFFIFVQRDGMAEKTHKYGIVVCVWSNLKYLKFPK